MWKKNDTWQSKESDLRKALQEIDGVTTKKVVPIRDIVLWTRGDDEKFNSQRKNISTHVPEEIYVNHHTLMEYNGKLHEMSENSLAALGIRLELYGAALNTSSQLRDAYMDELCAHSKAKASIIERRGKVFGVFSDKYCYVPQESLMNIIESALSELNEDNPDIKFKITQFETGIKISFPSIRDDISKMYHLPETMTPGLYITTSDTSDSAVSVQEVWTLKGIDTLGCRVGRKHLGVVDINDLIRQMKRKIFKNYTYVPEKLCEMLLIDIDYVDVEYIIKKLGIHKIIGNKRTQELISQLSMEFAGRTSLTAYNVAVSFLSLADRIDGLKDAQKMMIGEACYGILDYKFEEEKVPIVLT
ncbi:MAG: hypothetical protein IJ192_12445 [Clostridia bacterium]|nr:hypothetical protein [Clostridia bacterium]